MTNRLASSDRPWTEREAAIREDVARDVENMALADSAWGAGMQWLIEQYGEAHSPVGRGGQGHLPERGLFSDEPVPALGLSLRADLRVDPMSAPRIMLATLCLNEMEWLPKLYEQHKNWPGVMGWCFIEAADRAYAAAAPDMVSAKGLSVDGTTQWLAQLVRDPEASVAVGSLGLVGDPALPAQGKVTARNGYMKAAFECGADWIVVLDADEFYTLADQQRITEACVDARGPICYRQRHLWRPPFMRGEVEEPHVLEVVGGYWAIPHCRVWPYFPGMVYRKNHNYPELMSDRSGNALVDRMIRLEDDASAPQCIHMGFASEGPTRAAKHRYYETRGEGANDGRQKYVDCRRAWEEWTPGAQLPHGARVIPYSGPVPECFGA